jgi:hypothetical protein
MDSYRHFALNRMLQQLVVAGRDPKTRSSR